MNLLQMATIVAICSRLLFLCFYIFTFPIIPPSPRSKDALKRPAYKF